MWLPLPLQLPQAMQKLWPKSRGRTVWMCQQPARSWTDLFSPTFMSSASSLHLCTLRYAPNETGQSICPFFLLQTKWNQLVFHYINPLFLFSPLQVDPNPDHASRTEERRIDACPSRWRVFLNFPWVIWGVQRNLLARLGFVYFSPTTAFTQSCWHQEKSIQPTNKDLEKYPQLSWTNLPSLSERNRSN